MPESIQLAVQLLFWAATLPAVAGCLYLLLLSLLSGAPGRPSYRLSTHPTRFDVIVPAHDEGAGIARTVRSLHSLDWPHDAFRVLVIADNCSDDTAAKAAAAGALVLERTDSVHRGKGHALQWAFSRSVHEGWADAVVVVDADSEASPDLLRAFAARLENGAVAIQAHYGVLNPEESWRTRLMTVAFAAIHGVRSRSRERLGLSCGIRGNGWCVATSLLRRMPYEAFSLAEDVEYGIRLGLAGHRVHYADEAQVRGEMTSRAGNAASQRRRWEQGRNQLRQLRRPLLLRSIRQGDLVCLDLLLDLLLPPLSQLGLWLMASASATAVLSLLKLPLPGAAIILTASVAALVLYVLRGWQLSGLGLNVCIDFLRVPYFVAWKLLQLAKRGSGEWLRTGRERP